VAAAMPWLVAVAAAFALWRLIALGRAAAALQRLRRRCVPLPVGLEARLTGWMATRDRGRRAQLLLSPDLASPAVLGSAAGHGEPIIALPRWAIDALDVDSLDLIVLHERAHVARGDDRDLLVQSAIEAVFCWHPAVRWVGRRLDAERERACDDDVVRLTGRATHYARCLVGVAARAAGTMPLRVAPGVGRPGRHLTARVERLLAGPPAASGTLRVSWLGGGALALAATVAISAALWPRLHVGGPKWGRIPTSSMTSLPTRALPAKLSVALRVDPPAPRPRERDGVPTPRVRDQDIRFGPRASIGTPPVVAASDAAPVPALVADTARSPALSQPASPPPTLPVEVDDASTSDTLGAVPLASGPLPATTIAHPFMATAGMRKDLSTSPEQPNPWKRTADAGESIGRGAAHAGVKTAGFFSRMGRAIASSF
jgi:hypothetical protein